jgi:hypothetical protein
MRTIELLGLSVLAVCEGVTVALVAALVGVTGAGVLVLVATGVMFAGLAALVLLWAERHSDPLLD